MADPTVPDRSRIQTALPTALTSFVGREREIEQIVALVRRPSVRLVTLVGPGGVGKTRLAIRVAEELMGEFADDVTFVALAPIADADLVIPTVAQALGVREAGHPRLLRHLAAAIGGRKLLLVLDNFEHLLPAASLLTDLLVQVRALTLLVTSRVVLHVSGEQVFPVSPLPLFGEVASGDPSEPLTATAVRLFVERARAAQPDFDPGDGRTVADICRWLDGLPLAIELAAARVALFPPQPLLARLARRLPLLGGGPRDAPARLRTMRDAIAWSHDLLNPAEQSLFRRLAVFAGGFTFEAAEAVWAAGGGRQAYRTSFSPPAALPRPPAAPVLEGIAALVDHSLLERVSGGGEPRYRMLETIREFAWERLIAAGESAATRSRHAEFFLRLAEEADEELVRAHDTGMLARLETDQDNVRAALDWLDESADALGMLRLAGAMAWFWYYRGLIAEGSRRLEVALEAAASEAPERLPGGNGETVSVRARALTGLGLLVQIQGNLPRAIELFEETGSLYRSAGDAGAAAIAETLLGGALVSQGSYEQARPRFEAALPILQAGGVLWEVHPLFHLGLIEFAAGNFLAAEELCTKTWELYDAAGVRLDSIDPIRYLGLIACARGGIARAAGLFTEELSRLRQRGSPEAIGNGLADVATLAATRGGDQLLPSARLFGAADAICRDSGATLPLPARATYDRTATRVRAVLGTAIYQDAFVAGQGLTIATALAEAEAALAAALESALTSESATSAEGLTGRELDVLRLLVAGWSNPQIADALYISRTTARTHVSRILAKLGVRTRTEAADYAHRHGLI